MSKPEIAVSIEPEENGKLVYLAVAPMEKGKTPSNLMGFRLSLTNNGAKTETLKKITVTLVPTPGQPGNPPPAVFAFDRDLAIGASKTGTTYIDPDESIPMPAFSIAQAVISLKFEGHDEPVGLTRQVAKHKSPTPQGSYRFFASTDDMNFDEYFSQKARHTGGSQYFGYDFGVRGWDPDKKEFTGSKPGTSGDRNEHSLSYGKPIYAMADGTVISFANDVEENPIPGERALIRQGDEEGGPVSAISLTTLSEQRMLTASRTQAGKLKITIWSSTPDGKELSRLGELEAETISQVTSASLSSKRAITAVRTDSGHLKVIVWSISNDGMTITRLGEDDAGAVDRFVAASLSDTRVAAAIRTAEGNLKLIVWDVSANGLTLTRIGSAQAGAVKQLDLALLLKSRLLTAVQTSDDKLKVIVWDVADGGNITRRGDASGGEIRDLAVAQINRTKDRAGTAIRTADNKLKIIVWDIDEGGNPIRSADLEAGEVSSVTIARVTDDDNDLATCVITKEGTLKINTWKYDDEKKKITRYSNNEAGATSLIDLARLSSDSPLLLATAVRTAGGNVKVIIWQLSGGGGNFFNILYGDELVLHAHMIPGSLNPKLLHLKAAVKQGDFLGKLGNSGSSSGPHHHIHCSQVPANLTVDQIIENQKNGTLSGTLRYRPVPFHNAQAMRLSDPDDPDGKLTNVKPGIMADNKFAVVNQQGFYWEKMAVWPGLTTPGIPTGRSEMAFHAVKSGDYQELFDKITGAGYQLDWIDGYAVGNDLRFNVLFRPAGNDGRSAHHNLNSEQYQKLFDDNKEAGRRLVHINSYQVGNNVFYAAIFAKNNGIGISAYHGVSAEQHQANFDSLKANGFAPINVSVVSTGGQRRYTALYEKRNVGGFVLKSALTPDQYQTEFDAHKSDGLHVAYVDAYQHAGGVRFSAIWNRENSGSTHARHDLSSAEYQHEYETTTSEGYLTTVVAGYAVGSQHTFLGVWRK